jgi:hypothetical protein
MENFKTEEWVIVPWKKNQELGIITSVHIETSTVSVSINPYKFDDTNTVINFKNIIKLSESQTEVLKQLIEEIQSTEKKLKKLKQNVDLIPKINMDH